MALQTNVTILDDLDGSPDATTYQFGHNGNWYDIDLAGDNAEEFGEYLGKLLAAARPSVEVHSKGTKAAKGKATRSNRNEAQQVREWAIAEGYGVSERGRISADIRAAYVAAH